MIDCDPRTLTVTSAALLLACVTPLVAQQLPSAEIERHANAQAPQAVELFREYLRIPNDAHFPDDLRPVIDWLTVELQQRGFRTEELETGRVPLLLAERTFPEADRTLLVYLQADGQPVDTARWHQASPYEPVLRERGADGEWHDIPWDRLSDDWDPEWRIFARSTADSKGQNVQFLGALSAMDAAGVTPNFNVKVIVDSEEELGSPNLPAAVERYRDRLAADMLVIFDGPRHPTNQPTLTFGARGIATITLTVYGPRVPQHSGHYGNWAPNPALRLAQILASMKDEFGRVTVPGFYDGIVLDEATRSVLARVPDDEAAIRQQLGIAETDSVGTTLQEARQYPSLNVRGMASGWVGEQRRTIVPAFATAEIDVRLVKESDPDHLLGLIRRHIEGLGYYVIDHEPTDAERQSRPRIATFTSNVSYAAYRTEIDSDIGRWLTNAMVHLFGEEPIKIRTSGGSIPISPFVATLGAPAVTVPTVNPDNNQHSPNENLRLGNFVEGIQVMLAILQQPMP
ncbi:MAG: M20/M25/M40 family metallo-hydrolase [Gemmatimonadota bacterium]|nr:MAG: M20/M25/M40 family metallo-hydrolase [Gemmatimonadota bacterium]